MADQSAGHAPPRILRAAKRRTNAELIADADTLGHVRGRLLDATYGKGVWWRLLRGETLSQAVGMDLVHAKVTALPRGVVADFRRPPFRPGSFRCIFHDADYKMSGTPTTPLSKWVRRPGDATVDSRYGVDVRKAWQKRIADMLDGIAWWEPCTRCRGTGEANTGEASPADLWRAYGLPVTEISTALARGAWRTVPAPCARCARPGNVPGRGEMQGLATLLEPGGTMLVKCMDQVVAGKVRFQSKAVMDRAEAAGLEVVSRLDKLGAARWQDPERGQKNEASNYSSLIILKDPRPRPRTRKK